MNVTIHSSFLPHTDPDASLAFYRDVLGFEVRLDVGYENLRWITVGPVGQPDTAIVLHPPAANPGTRTAMRVPSARASARLSITRLRPASRTDSRRVALPSVTRTRAVRPARAGGDASTTRRPRTRTDTSARR